MENQTPLRVGIIGCGYQGGILAQTIIKGNAWRVVACADPDFCTSYVLTWRATGP